MITDWRFNQILVARIAKAMGISSFISINDIKHWKKKLSNT